jgi:hypothetical protein
MGHGEYKTGYVNFYQRGCSINNCTNKTLNTECCYGELCNGASRNYHNNKASVVIFSFISSIIVKMIQLV